MKNRSSHIMVLTGEPSGDVHGASLVKAMQQVDPTLTFSGIGGSCMADAGVDLFFSIENLSAMGLTEVIFQFRSIKQAFGCFTSQLKTTRPDLLILIDYPGFNLKAARFAKHHSCAKVFYYITPKIWAWNRSRIQQIKQFVDHAGLIFPFEEKLYKKAHIPATYVGNPLVDQYPYPLQRTVKKTATRSNPWIIGLLPGSRKTEIHNLLHLMVTSAKMIHTIVPHTRFLVSGASSIPKKEIETILASHGKTGLFDIIYGNPGQIFEQADMLMAASGTITLEAALCEIPTVIMYKMSPISFRIAKTVVKVKYAGLANIIVGSQVMPELLQTEASPQKICKTVLDMLDNLPGYTRKLGVVRRLLGGTGATRRAAKIAVGLLQKTGEA